MTIDQTLINYFNFNKFLFFIYLESITLHESYIIATDFDSKWNILTGDLSPCIFGVCLICVDAFYLMWKWNSVIK